MKTKLTLKALNAELKELAVEIRPWRSTKRFADAKYIVRVRTGQPRTMSDGTQWDGWEHVGYFETLESAAAAAHACNS